MIFREGQTEAQRKAVIKLVARGIHRLLPVDRRRAAESKVMNVEWGKWDAEPEVKAEGICAVCHDEVSRPLQTREDADYSTRPTPKSR